MTIKKILDRNGFVSVFDTENGDYFRTGLLDGNGNDTGIDAFISEFPQLIDIGIMGHCTHGLSGKCGELGVECYQRGNEVQEPNMTVEEYEHIIAQCEGRTFQVALGGRGDPDQHENFEDLLRITRKYGIVPNITTSGYGLTLNNVECIKKYCGAAAVSYYKTPYMYEAINMLSESGVITNLHYVLGNNSIDEAINILSSGKLPQGVDRIIFLLHKPVGLGSVERILRGDDPKVQKFFRLLSQENIAEMTGFDSCCVPGIIKYCPEISPDSYDACESGRFSVYIDSSSRMSPCSFDKRNRISIDLNNVSIEDAWNSDEFVEYRYVFKTRCTHCKDRINCLGGCPICHEINLCGETVR